MQYRIIPPSCSLSKRLDADPTTPHLTAHQPCAAMIADRDHTAMIADRDHSSAARVQPFLSAAHEQVRQICQSWIALRFFNPITAPVRTQRSPPGTGHCHQQLSPRSSLCRGHSCASMNAESARAAAPRKARGSRHRALKPADTPDCCRPRWASDRNTCQRPLGTCFMVLVL